MLTFISSVFYLWILHLYFQNFFVKRKLNTILKCCIWVVFYFVHYFVLGKMKPFLLVFGFGCILLFMLCKCLYIANYKEIAFSCLFIYILGMIIEICVSITLESVYTAQKGTDSLGSVISKLIMLVFVHAITLFKSHDVYGEPAFLYWLILMITVVSSVFAIYVIYILSQTASGLYRWLSTSAILALLLINIIIYILYQKLCETANLHIQFLLMQEQITHYQESLANKEVNDSLLRKERHNLKNQLIGIRAYAAQNNSEKIIEFINVLLSENEFGLSFISFTDNVLIDSLLISKRNLAIQNKITYNISANIPAQLPFADADLCILVGNALDNAFESCLVHTEKPKFVNVNLLYKTDCLYCHFENSYYHVLKHSPNAFFHSTKKDAWGHGYGLVSIEHVTSKYNGTLKINSCSDVFSLKILLYPPQRPPSDNL